MCLLRKSKAAGPGEDQLLFTGTLPLLRCCASFLTLPWSRAGVPFAVAMVLAVCLDLMTKRLFTTGIEEAEGRREALRTRVLDR